MKPRADYLIGPSPPSGEAAAAAAQAAQRTAVAAAYFCRRVRSAGASSAGGSSSSPAASLHRKLQQAGRRVGHSGGLRMLLENFGRAAASNRSVRLLYLGRQAAAAGTATVSGQGRT